MDKLSRAQLGEAPNTSLRALLIHGAGGGAWEWRIWQRVFNAQGITTIAVRLFDHHQSDQSVADLHYHDYLQTAQSLYHQHRCNVLMGASLGGLLAAELSAMLAAPPQALVLVAPVPPTGLQHTSIASDSNTVKTWAHRHDLADTIAALPDVYPADQYLASQQWRDESMAVLHAISQPRTLSSTSTPSLMLVGMQDRDIDAKALYQWAAERAMAVLSVPASHVGLLIGQRAAQFASLVVDWLLAGKRDASA